MCGCAKASHLGVYIIQHSRDDVGTGTRAFANVYQRIALTGVCVCVCAVPLCVCVCVAWDVLFAYACVCVCFARQILIIHYRTPTMRFILVTLCSPASAKKAEQEQQQLNITKIATMPRNWAGACERIVCTKHKGCCRSKCAALSLTERVYE